MKEELQTIAIATLQGFEKDGEGIWRNTDGDYYGVSWRELPHYLRDRNTIIEAAKQCLDTLGAKIEFRFWFQALASGQKPLPNNFIPQYRRYTDSISEWFDMVTAPPAVWCEALLRTLNKWEQ